MFSYYLGFVMWRPRLPFLQVFVCTGSRHTQATTSSTSRGTDNPVRRDYQSCSLKLSVVVPSCLPFWIFKRTESLVVGGARRVNFQTELGFLDVRIDLAS